MMIRDEEAILKAERMALEMSEAQRKRTMPGFVLTSLVAMNADSVWKDKKWLEWRDPNNGDCIMHVVAAKSPLLLERLLKTSGGLALMDHVNDAKQTPLYRAVCSRQVKCVQLLRAAGAHESCLMREHCPFECAYFNEFHRNSRELGIALASGGVSRAKLQEFLRIHTTVIGNQKWQQREYLQKCADSVRLRYERAYKTLVSALWTLKRKTSNKDVFQFILVPMLRHIWENRRYEPCWDVVGDQESIPINKNGTK